VEQASGLSPGRPAVGPPEIGIAWRVRGKWASHALLQRVARHVAAVEGFTCGRLSVAVVGRRHMASLHRRYLGIDGPTDVLTFDLGCEQRHGWLDAEIVLCADIARSAAVQRGGTSAAAWAELALYLVHGVLHLAGYDDRTARDARRMHAREDELLRQLGLLLRSGPRRGHRRGLRRG
jgi:probable rRNA maturation factor